MTDSPDDLRPAASEEVAQALSFALCFDGRKRNHQADNIMARITADRLIKHLDRSGFVVMKKPPRASHSAPPVPIISAKS